LSDSPILLARGMIQTMDKSLQARVAANEGVFREVNEAIERGLWPGEEDSLVAFRCECASLECGRMVELTPKAYERVRADPRHFFVLRGHELAEVETVVESHEQYVVVEKRAKAGKLAEASDPRC
jgi:hypothetical protein